MVGKGTPMPEAPALAVAGSVDEVRSVSASRLGEARRILSAIVAEGGPRSLENTLVPFNDLMVEAMEAVAQAELAFNTHPEAAVREAANAAYLEGVSLITEIGLHRPLYEALASLDVDGEEGDTRFAMHKILRDFRRAGVDRDESVRARIKRLWQEITATGSEFDRTINEDVRSIRVKPEDLAGLPEDYLAQRPPGDDGLVAITTDYPDSLPVFQYGRVGEVRRRLLYEFRNRGHPKNLATLDRLIAKRDELAKLLGYANWADYATEDKMIGSAKAAEAFIDKVTEASASRAREDYGQFLERKRRDVSGAKTLDPWDPMYYRDRVKAERHAYESREVRAYFPFARVRDGLFSITGSLFGIRYEPVRDAPRWHESVETYDVFEGEDRLGRFYLDLHPRPGKFTHAAAFPLVVGLTGRRLPQAALVCNFPDPAKGPALMTHGDVVTFFHEFGHLIHMMLSGRQRWVKNSMDGIEWDFVEAPSQLLEEWARNPKALRTFAAHHETGEPIPTNLVERMERSEAVGRGLEVRRQMFLAAYSLNCYTRSPEEIDTGALAKEIHGRYELVPWFEGTHLQCGFGHLNGYSALYYTYMWSLVIAKDLFRAFRDAGDILNPEQAGRYRRTILDPGSSRPAAEMVREYLGREPAFDAFSEWLDRSDA